MIKAWYDKASNLEIFGAEKRKWEILQCNSLTAWYLFGGVMVLIGGYGTCWGVMVVAEGSWHLL